MAVELAPQRSSLLGVGLYSIPEAAHYIGATPRTVHRWFEGYEFGHDDTARFSPPIISPEVGCVDGEPVVTFLDFIELRFIALFHQHGVSLHVIRSAAASAARLFRTKHPFAVRRFDTDGDTIFATLRREDAPPDADRAKYMQELTQGQYVFDELVHPYLKASVDFDIEFASRYWPLGRDARVVMDPTRAFGKPIDAPTRVPTRLLYLASDQGNRMEDAARTYDVPLEAVARAVTFEASFGGT